jgi:subtilisin-like proprotein convertase family protein
MNVVSLLRLVTAAGLAAVALVAVPTGPAGAAGVPCQRTFSSGRVNLDIPDPGSAVSDIDVPEDGLVVSDVDVTVNINHQFVADLIMVVTSLTDTESVRSLVRIFDAREENGANLVGMVFDDEANDPISWGAAPFTGRFKPVKPLAALDGTAGGRYRLNVGDGVDTIAGTLVEWSVTLTYARCDLDADGVEDHVDSCLGTAATTPSGCPLVSRRLTGAHRQRAFKGVLSSSFAPCRTDRLVTIMRVRRGRDAMVGSTHTRLDGSYRLARPRKRGRYYAVSPRVVLTGAECTASRSGSFRVR